MKRGDGGAKQGDGGYCFTVNTSEAVTPVPLLHLCRVELWQKSQAKMTMLNGFSVAYIPHYLGQVDLWILR